MRPFSLVECSLAHWLSEASDFTPWLVRKENLDILGETLGIDLELEAQERPVGPFGADILCKGIGTLIACSSPARWPICSWRAGTYCASKRRNASATRPLTPNARPL